MGPGSVTAYLSFKYSSTADDRSSTRSKAAMTLGRTVFDVTGGDLQYTIARPPER
jgi:hypothetical protein